MPVTSVYVSDDLKRRMDKVKNENWSAVAAAAFERRLGEIAKQKEKKTMEDVIQRLRASDLEAQSEQARSGHEAGQEWAKGTAEATELRRLAKYMENSENQGTFSGYKDQEAAQLFYDAVMLPSGESSEWSDVTDFWEDTLGLSADDYRNSDFVDGFAEGALEVWREVQDKL